MRKKYPEFLRAFPNFRVLAKAPLREILLVWQGMGYNRRAVALKKIAVEVMRNHNGALPRDSETLRAFPGIGAGTVGAISAFAFNKPLPFIETNIRSVFLYFFFSNRTSVPDDAIMPLVERTLDKRNPREWYYALMDYGAMLKTSGENPSRRSAHHGREKPFTGSNRELRGAIVRLLLRRPRATVRGLARALGAKTSAVAVNLLALRKEGFDLSP